MLALGQPDSGCAVNRRQDLVFVLQKLHQEIAVELHVLHDQDFFHCSAPAVRDAEVRERCGRGWPALDPDRLASAGNRTLPGDRPIPCCPPPRARLWEYLGWSLLSSTHAASAI